MIFSPRFPTFSQGELWGNSIEIVRVDHEQQIHLLFVSDQFLCDFNGHLPAHAESAEVIRPFRLQLSYLSQVTFGHLLGRRQVIVAAVKSWACRT